MTEVIPDLAIPAAADLAAAPPEAAPDAAQICDQVRQLTAVGDDMLHWFRGGKLLSYCPRELRQIADSEHFAPAYVRVAAEQARDNAARGRDPDTTLRGVEYDLVRDVLGIDSGLARAFHGATRERTMRMHRGYAIPKTQGGGIAINAWEARIGAFAANATRLGAAALTKLHHRLDFVCFDRYFPTQLERMSKVIDGDEETIEQLRDGDSSFVVSDVLDHNGANDLAPQVFEEDNALLAEARRPRDILYNLEYLRKTYGIRPCKLAVVNHGNTGVNIWGDPGDGYILHWPNSNLNTRRSWIWCNLDNFDLKEFFHTALQPHSETGDRVVVAAACSQARRMQYLTRPSFANELVRRSDPADNVVVVAHARGAHVERVNGEQRFWDKNGPVPTYEYRHVGSARRPVRRRMVRNIRPL